MILDDFARMSQFGSTPASAEQHCTALVQGPAHLFGRHFRIFPPAAVAYARRRNPERSASVSSASSDPCSFVLHSASSPLPAWPAEKCAQSSLVERPPASPVPAVHPRHCLQKTSLHRSSRLQQLPVHASRPPSRHARSSHARLDPPRSCEPTGTASSSSAWSRLDIRRRGRSRQSHCREP